MSSRPDRNELLTLYEKHSRGLLAYACSFVPTFASAEDILHQVFARLLRGDIEIAGAPAAYLYRAVRNAALNDVRNRARAPIAVTPIAPVIAAQSQNGERGASHEQSSNALPEGPGKDIIDRACSSCHRADAVWARRFSTELEIVELTNREIGRGADISQPEMSVVVEYLAANFRRKKLK